MTAPDMTRIRKDHGLAQAHWETRNLPTARQMYGVSWSQGARNGWWAGIRYALETQAKWDDLTVPEAIEELRKKEGSLFWPLLSDDPCFPTDCPGNDCPSGSGQVLITAEGFCPDCGHELT